MDKPVPANKDETPKRKKIWDNPIGIIGGIITLFGACYVGVAAGHYFKEKPSQWTKSKRLQRIFDVVLGDNPAENQGHIIIHFFDPKQWRRNLSFFATLFGGAWLTEDVVDRVYHQRKYALDKTPKPEQPPAAQKQWQAELQQKEQAATSLQR